MFHFNSVHINKVSLYIEVVGDGVFERRDFVLKCLLSLTMYMYLTSKALAYGKVLHVHTKVI